MRFRRPARGARQNRCNHYRCAQLAQDAWLAAHGQPGCTAFGFGTPDQAFAERGLPDGTELRELGDEAAASPAARLGGPTRPDHSSASRQGTLRRDAAAGRRGARRAGAARIRPPTLIERVSDAVRCAPIRPRSADRRGGVARRRLGDARVTHASAAPPRRTHGYDLTRRSTSPPRPARPSRAQGVAVPLVVRSASSRRAPALRLRDLPRADRPPRRRGGGAGARARAFGTRRSRRSRRAARVSGPRRRRRKRTTAGRRDGGARADPLVPVDDAALLVVALLAIGVLFVQSATAGTRLDGLGGAQLQMAVRRRCRSDRVRGFRIPAPRAPRLPALRARACSRWSQSASGCELERRAPLVRQRPMGFRAAAERGDEAAARARAGALAPVP